MPPIVLTSIHIPQYLDRPQIVTALGEHRYQVHEFERWAELLDHNILRVLQQDLSRLLSTEVLISPAVIPQALKLSVEILIFHVDAQGNAQLIAQWRLHRDEQLLKIGHGHYIEHVEVENFTKTVDALNFCLTQMARNIAGDIQAIDDVSMRQSQSLALHSRR